MPATLRDEGLISGRQSAPASLAGVFNYKDQLFTSLLFHYSVVQKKGAKKKIGHVGNFSAEKTILCLFQIQVNFVLCIYYDRNSIFLQTNMQIIAIKVDNTSLEMMQLFVFSTNRKGCYTLRLCPSQACGKGSYDFISRAEECTRNLLYID